MKMIKTLKFTRIRLTNIQFYNFTWFSFFCVDFWAKYSKYYKSIFYKYKSPGEKEKVMF